MPRPRRRLRWWLKWAGAIICLILVLLFVYSTARFVTWNSQDLEYQANLMLGTVNVAWRPDGWKLEDDPYAGVPGWSVGTYSGGIWIWWIATGANRAFEWVTLPLWIPVLIIALPTAVLWYRDRRYTREWCRRLTDWLHPVRRKRMTLWLVLACTLVHGLVSVATLRAIFDVSGFFGPFIERAAPKSIVAFINWALWWVFWIAPCLILAAPLWGILWAWLYVRTLNRLGPRPGLKHCFECGYDLTGNVSGICPECGGKV